jgi:cell division protein FtsA
MLTATRSKGAQAPIVVLDLGSSKVTCLIARREAEGPSVIGVGHQRSRGIKAGVILDLEQVDAVVRAAVAQAERMADVAVRDVSVAVSCGRPRSHTFVARAEVESGIVRDDDIQRVLGAARAYAERDGRTLVHLNRMGFRLDEAPGFVDPRGMAAAVLAADLHAVTADDAPVRNLLLALERAHLGVAGTIAAPYAGAMAVTSEEERQSGVTVVDLGGGATTIAMFAEGHFVHVDALAVGSHHITFDISRALVTPLAEAERIKALYGTMVFARSDEHERVSFPVEGDEEGEIRHVSKAELRDIVALRVASILGLLRERIERTPLARHAARRVVLTGGGSQLVGLGECAADRLGCPVRVARPLPVPGLPKHMCGPAFAVAAGMLGIVASADASMVSVHDRGPGPSGYLGRVGMWLREF